MKSTCHKPKGAPVKGVEPFSGSFLGVCSYNVMVQLFIGINWDTVLYLLFLIATPTLTSLTRRYGGWCSFTWVLEIITRSWRDRIPHCSTLSVKIIKKGDYSFGFFYFPRHINHEVGHLVLFTMVSSFSFHKPIFMNTEVIWALWNSKHVPSMF